jgi:D-alanyl-D-alanine carboxypeptidase
MKQLRPFALLLTLSLVSSASPAQQRAAMVAPRPVPGFLVPGTGEWSGGSDRALPVADPTLPARLQDALDRALLEVDSTVRHGVSAGVIAPGLGKWTGVAGLSHDDVDITPDTRFEIGSVTKTFVAATIFKLIEEGKLTLDDSLGMWLPSYPNVDGGVRIRQLLNHSSGIFDYVNNDTTAALTIDAYFYNPDKHWTPEEILEHLGTPRFKAGTKTEYSNTNFLLLGMVIGKASGRPAAEEIRRRFLDPLGMTSTYLGWDEEIDGELAHGWAAGFDPSDPTKQADISSIPLTAGLSLANTAGGVVTTAGDLVSWADALYNGRVLDSASMAAMMTIKSTSEGNLGLGVFRWQYYSKLLYGHDGAIPGYNSWMFTIPRDTVSVVVLLNSLYGGKDVGVGTLARALLEEIYRSVSSVDDERAPGMMLEQNTPNPFAGETVIRFAIPERTHARLDVYDALGRLVATPVDGMLDAGSHDAVVRIDGAPAGSYFYTLRAGRSREVRGMRLER